MSVLITHTISINNAVAVTMASLGISSAALGKKTNGVDTLNLTVSLGSIADVASFAFGGKVDLIQTTASIPPVVKCIFSGTVEEIPRQAMGGGNQSVNYVIYGPAYSLQRCDFSQRWTYTSATDGSAIKDYEPTVCLGNSNLGVRITSGVQISEVIDYAILRGVNIAKGTFALGVTTPYDERSNITCWDAIVSMLRYTPDYCIRWDYDTVDGDGHYQPTCHLVNPELMTTAAYAVTSLQSATFVPRLDIQVPGILIIFNFTGSYDGQPVKYRTTQTAGAATDPRRVSLVFELEGMTQTFSRQEIVVEDYPADWTDATGKAWLKAQIPWLASIADGDWSVASVTGNGALELPSRLISGSIIDWMKVDQENETFTAVVTYTKRDAEGGVVTKEKKDIPFTCLSTDATTKEYKQRTDLQEPEPVPSDLAANLFASWNRLHYDGSFSFKEQVCTCTISPGYKVSITGSLTAWATMAAIVQDVTYDLFNGSTSVTTGTCGRLEADNLMSIYRAARGRRFSTRVLQRDEPADENGIPGAQGTSKSDTADGAPADQIHRLRVVDVDAGDLTHQIDLFPATTTFDAPANGAATLITPRERVQPYMVDGVLKAKLAQVLCSDGYGSEIPLGGSRPADPSNPLILGTASEGASDDALTDTYNGVSPGAYDGVQIFLETRDRYMDAGSKILYAYGRWLTFPAAIAPTTSAETRIEIDSPQA